MKKEQTQKKLQLGKQSVAILRNGQTELEGGIQGKTVIILPTNPPGSCAGSIIIVGACPIGTIVEV